MRDLLRLGRYLKRYKARIALAVVASFFASACLIGVIALVRPIAEEAFAPAGPAPGAPAASAPADGPGSEGEPSRARDEAGATGSAADAPRSGGASATARLAEDLQSKTSGLRHRIEAALGLDRLGPWLRASPFTRVPLFIVIVFLLKGIFSYFAEYWLKWVGTKTIQDLRLDLYEKVLGQSTSFFTIHPTGTLNSRVMGDVSRLQKITSTNLADAVRLCFTVIFMAAMVFVISWRLALVCLVALPLIVVPLVRLGRRLKRASRASQEHAAGVSNVLNETIVGNRIVKAFGMETFELARFRAALTRMFRADVRALRTIALTSPLLELVGAICGGALFWYAGRNIVRGHLDGPSFFMFLVALGYLFVSTKSLSAMNNDLQQAMAAASRVFEMMDTPNSIVEAAGAPALEPFSREVRLQHVSFHYGNIPVLDGVDFVARAGEVHALVGSSGAGKSTLVNLIPRFYDVTEGAVTIDGRDVRGVTIASIRRQIALVTQEMFLFNDSVRNNIAYGHPAIPIERVRGAAHAAGADAFIEALPDGYDTVIGEQGVRLSAGQRQRITIARAFLKDAPILILDEATSALDSESEALVQRALEVLMRGRTSIVIAHRLSTIRRADCIHVLEQGRIVERGRHDELIGKGGLYARLSAIQFQGQGQREPA